MKIVSFGVGRPKSGTVLTLAVFCLFLFFLARGLYNYSDRLVSLELKAERFPGQVTLADPKVLREIDRQISEARILKNTEQTGFNYRLTLKSRRGSRTLLFNKPALLYDPRTGKGYVLKDQGKCLEAVLKKLNAGNPYGELLPWPEVNKIFRKYDKARVRDLETGKSFLVQRRAGTNHADVQPLTAEDSAIMKAIYDGQWSWKRRAIVVEIKGHRIAASMNGMPHGAGAISGNNFDGHFCIHFKGSKTHSNHENLAHQMMVWKAAGVFEDMLAGAEPGYLLQVMLTAVEQDDAALAAKLVKASAGNKKIVRQLEDIRWLAVARISEPEKNGNRWDFKVKMSYGLKDGTQVKNREVLFQLVRDTGKIRWKIDPSVLERLREKEEDTSESDRVNFPDSSVYRDWKVDMDI